MGESVMDDNDLKIAVAQIIERIQDNDWESSIYAGEEIIAIVNGSRWQPIETAPKDGSGFIVNCGQVESGCTLATYEKGVLVSLFDGHPFAPWVAQPTHWMPLPPPPTEGTE